MSIKLRLKKFLADMKSNELTPRTIKKYEADIIQFLEICKIVDTDDISKEVMLSYKQYLQDNFKTASINNKITVINKFIDWLELPQNKLKHIKQQKKTSLDDILSEVDYERLLRIAKRLGKDRIFYIMKTLAGTGIRIDELKYLTVEAVKTGYAEVINKGKIRGIVISRSLSKELKTHCKEHNITEGSIFITKNKKPLDKAYIWRELKYVSGQARVKKNKVHAHSFRHLFAKTYLRDGGNITHLADLLGHSSLETTRIYTMQTPDEQRAFLDKQEELRRKKR